MKDLFPVLFGIVIGVFIFCITDTLKTLNDPTEKQVGYSYAGLQELKRKCEEDLPRKKQCTILVQYLPQQEGK